MLLFSLTRQSAREVVVDKLLRIEEHPLSFAGLCTLLPVEDIRLGNTGFPD